MAANPRYDTAEVLERQAKAVSMRQSGMTYRQIAAQDIGFDSPSGVHAAVKRALSEQVITNTTELVVEETSRIDSLMRTYWPKAKSGDAKAAVLIVKLMERKSKYWGLDFMDGIAERHVEVEEVQLKLAAEIVRRILGDDDLGLTDEQKQRVPAIANRHLTAVA